MNLDVKQQQAMTIIVFQKKKKLISLCLPAADSAVPCRALLDLCVLNVCVPFRAPYNMIYIIHKPHSHTHTYTHPPTHTHTDSFETYTP